MTIRIKKMKACRICRFYCKPFGTLSSTMVVNNNNNTLDINNNIIVSLNKDKLKQAKEIYQNISKQWNESNLKSQLKEIKEITSRPNFWENSSFAQQVIKKQNLLEEKVDFITKTILEIHNQEELLLLAEEEQDLEMICQLDSSIEEMINKLSKKELESMMSDPQDIRDCYLEIHTGAGGVDAADWSNMLLNMYLNWARKTNLSNFDVSIEDISHNKEGGIRFATLLISGMYAYGYLKFEQGVHRLVRLSPFDSAHKRHTSFSSVRVYPSAIDDEDISSIFQNISEKDLRIDTIRAATAGGQHANKTESGVRVTHIPTGIQVQSTFSRSQHQNKEKAIQALKSRLQQLERDKKIKELKDITKQEMESNQFGGNIIRSYVLHPYQMVKDSRANEFTLSNAEQIVLGEDVDSFNELLKSILRNKTIENNTFNDDNE